MFVSARFAVTFIFHNCDIMIGFDIMIALNLDYLCAVPGGGHGGEFIKLMSEWD